MRLVLLLLALTIQQGICKKDPKKLRGRRQSPITPCWPSQDLCVDGACVEGTFQCDNGNCINTTLVCDKTDHCGDGSDEKRYVVGFKCPIGAPGDVCVLPQHHVHDEFTHCNNEADESETSDKYRRIFLCFDESMVISDSQQCDGVIDCPDLSDECPCEDRNEEICARYCTREREYGRFNCTARTFVCRNGLEIERNKICDGVIDCGSGIDEKYCSLRTTNKVITCPGDVNNTTRRLARMCDGRPECYDFSDECSHRCGDPSNLPRFCKLKINKVPLHYRCKSSINITVEHVCDGKWSGCDPRIPEEEGDCPGRFYCKSSDPLSIDKSLTCNGYEDCEDGSDEVNCTRRYHCDAGDRPLSVPMKFVLDGVKDCLDGSDECPKDLDDNPIGSRTHLISLPFFQFWVWLVGLSCLFGNIYIIADKIKKLPNIRKSEGLVKCNHFLLFNLAIADLTMAIYLLGISIKHHAVAGNYCRYDVPWRTGNICFWLGATSVISSEASVFFLTLLTTMRLVSVHRPIQSRNMSLKWTIPLAGLAWTAALLFGLLPRSSLMRESFTSGAFIPSKFTSSPSIRLRAGRKFAILLSRFTPNSSAMDVKYSWSEVSHYLESTHPAHGMKGFYGYYAEHGVCMPNFYVTTRERSWRYSFTIIMVNFVLFVYILSAYIAIYRKATTSKVQSTNDRNSRMQRKIIRLVATDFCCWAPVCIIALLHFNHAIDASQRIYALTAIVILPINSVLNPLFYSDLFDIVWKKRKRVTEIFTLSSKVNFLPSTLPE